MNGRHRLVRRNRRGVSALAVSSLVAGLGVWTTVNAAPVVAAVDPCLTPTVQDVMISQGLPANSGYRGLVRGKSALVKLFMQKPSCAPAGATINITGASLRLTAPGLEAAIPPLGTLPLPALAPSSTAPIPAAEGDPLFSILGESLRPTGDATTVTFTATLNFTTTKADGSKVSDVLQVTKRPDGSAITAPLERASNPLRVLTVPMGNAGTVLAPNTADSQFPLAARNALTKGLTAVNRVLPVADGVVALNGTDGGLRTTMAAGLVNVPMTNGRFCGNEESFTDIDRQLNLARVNYNSVNPSAPADRVYGAIWQGISDGGVTGQPGCVDGYASINGTSAWGRVVDKLVDASTDPDTTMSFTGAIATMELLHTTGAVDSNDSRFSAGFHSKNANADVVTPDRAWNVPGRKWVKTDASSMFYRTSGLWNDETALLEKQDFDRLHCQLTPLLPGETTRCPGSTAVGRAAAAVTGTTDGAFFLAGSTDGTMAGTDAHTYVDDDVNYEQPDPTSDYRFVQLDAGGNVLDEQGFRVNQTHSHHTGGNGGGGRTFGTFGTEFEAFNETVELRLYKGDPDLPGSVLLHSRLRDEAPEFIATSLQGRTAALQATDRTPENLRLDVFFVCGTVVSPLVNAAKPIRISTFPTPVAAFAVPADTSLGCPTGRLRYRMSDGFLVSTRDEVVDSQGLLQPTAAIYAPVLGSVTTNKKVIALAGDARDQLDQPIGNLEWSLTGPGLPKTLIATGASTSYVPPAGGLAPGDYVLSLDAKRADGSLLATTSKALTVLPDADGDGLDDLAEQAPCFPANAVNDQNSAVIDSDFDGFANIEDSAPCVTANNARARFTSTSLNTGSSGNSVQLRLEGSTVDLTQVPRGDVKIIQIAGYRLSQPMPATSWSVTSPTEAKVTFDRGLLSAFLTSQKLSGPVPIFIGAAASGLRAGDADAPNTF